MLVSPQFAKKNNLNVKSKFQVLGGSLGGSKLCLINPTEGDDDLDYTVDYKNIFGTDINILDNLSKLFLLFEKGKTGNQGKRITMMVSGPSGCGKSTFCINYMNIYRQQLKDPEKYPIYFLTAITDDPRASKIKGCHIIDLNDDEMIDYYLVDPETRLTCKQDFFGKSPLNNSLIVVDDAENLGKSLQLLLESLLSDVMKYGRHSNTNLIWSRHALNNNNRLIQESLSEIMYFVLFRDSSLKRLTYFCEKYLEYGKQLVSWIRKDSGSRYTIVHNRCPAFTLNEDQIHILS